MAIYKTAFTRAQIEEALNRALNVVTEGKSFTLKGEWVSGGSYANSASTIDVVIYDGVSYFCRVTHSGRSTNPKADTTYWGQLAGYEPLIKNVPLEDIDESDTIFFTDASDNGSTKRVTLANFTSKFPSGRGIASIERTSGTGAPGTYDTYTITFTDGTTFDFQVYNGADGEGSGDMMQAVYDTDNDGKVNAAEVADVALSVDWDNVQDRPSTMTPTAHAASHKTGGSDALSPADIGAATSEHTHSDYMPKSGGTFTGIVTAQSNTSYTTPQIRNIVLSTSDPSGGNNGEIWIKYQ